MSNTYEQTLVIQTPGQDRMYPTQSDLSTLQYKFVKLDSNELLVAAGAGDVAVGILQDAPIGTATATKYGTVRLFGQSKVVLGGTVVVTLPYLKSDASANGIAVTTNKDAYNAIAKSGGVSGDIIVCIVQNGIYNV